ncbi:hypothetical protein [Amycolatopsis magusensis]|uniref:NlpC/P60 family protein n=1 Tax=Amycolatopsis magusensis TaxID=882444 RepID=A0ABS4PY62_9PSEU|nr:hypothetical protein [Amycolatopsis magusensis]MBP2184375.1 hypothetical protein [Amycolatopsis magusensis]
MCFLLALSFALVPSAAHGQPVPGDSGEANISPEISAEAIGALAAPIGRGEVLARAASWTGVPYSQTDYHPTPYGEFRQDCSGFVSMTWGLPGRPADPNGGTNTVGLAAISTPIAKDDLRPGDALIDIEGDSNTRHVALFESWANPERTRYWAYEQAGPTGNLGAEHRIIDYPYDGGSAQFKPYRYNNIVEDGGSVHHRLRAADGAWTPFGNLGMPTATQVATAAAPSGEVHALAVSGGQVHHRLRKTDDSWTGWGLVANPGSASAVTASTDDGGNLQVVAILNGQPHHRIRYAGNGTWSAWGSVGATGSFTAVAGAIDTAGKAFHLTAVFNGQVHHRVRNAAGAWTPWALVANPGSASAVTASTDDGGNLQVVAILNGQPHHRIRYASNGTWSAWGSVGATGSFTAVAGAIDKAGKVFHLSAVFNGQIHHRIRKTDGTWTPWAHAGNPGTALSLGATVDPDRALHLVATY